MDPGSRVALHRSSAAGNATDYLADVISTIDNASFLGPNDLSLFLFSTCTICFPIYP